MVDEKFKRGSRVEVGSDEEGFKGACYVATVIENPKNDKYVVVYDDLVESEENDSKHLSETVDVSYLRPLPPADKGEILRLHDIVDAYHLDGWWIGEVIQILHLSNSFLVYFQNTSDELIVHRDHLRLHFNWVQGKWELPIKQSQIYKMISQGATVEVTLESENFNVWHVGNVLQVEGNGKFLVKHRCFGVDDKPEYRTQVIDSQCIRPAPPPVEEQDFGVLHKVEAYYRFCWWTGVIQRIINDRKYFVLLTHSKAEMECNHFNLRPRLDWIDGKWTTTSPNTELLAIASKPFTTNRRKCTPRKHAGKYCGTARKKNDAAVRVNEDNMSVNEEELGASSETPVNNNRKKKMRDRENIEGSCGIKTAPKRKKSRLGKLSLEEQIAESNAGKDDLMLMTIDNEPNEDHFMLSCNEDKELIASDGHEDELLSRIPNISQVEDQKKETGTNTKLDKLPSKSVSDGHEETNANIHLTKDKADEILKNPRKEWLANGHGEESKFVDNGSEQQGVTTNIPVAKVRANETVAQQIDDHNIEGQLVIGGTLLDLSDDQPLLSGALLVADEFSTATDGEEHSQKSSAVDTKHMGEFPPLQNNIATGELGTPSAVTSCDSLKTEKVPFVKCSPLWNSVDSMEIYRKTEQKPHFSLLLKCREETREGLAIGYMVIFLTVVEKTLKLRCSDPSSVIKSYLQTVADLEKQGFEVEPVRARLLLLLAKKEKTRKLEAECKEIEDEITHKVLKKDEVGQVIIEINQKIEELVKKLNDAKSTEVMKEDEILTLRSKQEGICENVRSSRHEFESIAGCPL